MCPPPKESSTLEGKAVVEPWGVPPAAMVLPSVALPWASLLAGLLLPICFAVLNMAKPPKAEERPQYPSFLALLPGIVRHLFRGPFLAALFTVYVVHPAILLPLVEKVGSMDLGSFLPAWLVGLLSTYITPRLRARGYTLNDALFFVAVSLAVHETFYVVINSFYLFCDKQRWLLKYKMERTARMTVPQGILAKTWIQAARNHLVLQPIALLLFYTFWLSFPPLFACPQPPCDRRPLPFLSTFFHFVVAQQSNDLLLYIFHRALHDIPGLYHRYHKLHHTYVGTVGFAAEFAHPVEQVFANYLPSMGYCFVYSGNMDVSIFFVWLGWRLWQTYEAHSGYDFSESPPGRIGLLHGERARFHDWHHSDNRGNYGNNFIFDYFLGTMDSFVVMCKSKGKLV
eukprot:RCo042583